MPAPGGDFGAGTVVCVSRGMCMPVGGWVIVMLVCYVRGLHPDFLTL